MKTRHGWGESRLPLSQYLQIGVLVDDEIFDHFLNVLPPAYYSSDIVQIGEPFDHAEWGPVFATLKRVADGNWMYCGNCYRAQTDHTLPRY